VAGRRVLVVEDEAMIALLIESVLDEAGCRIVGPMADADAALAAIRSERVDAALLDICLSGARSYPIADALVARGVPFAFVSGLALTDMPPAYRNRPHVTKPFGPEAIVLMLERLIGTSAGRPALAARGPCVAGAL
jgi:CheY-like chemotaxis protein